jgi:hypothetical protein
MDGLSIGSGVVAFISIALQSAKVILDIVSVVKDGPRHVQELSYDVEQLRQVLERMSRLQIAEHADISIGRLLQRCSEDLSSYASRLRKMQACSTESRSGKFWKTLRAVVGEKDLEAMRTTIHSHLMSLTMQLTIVQL